MGAQPEGPTRESPVGLNPLGALDTCAPDVNWRTEEGQRVLISRPEFFTQDASIVVSALRNSFRGESPTVTPPRFLLSPAPINSEEEATQEGLRCNALIVLWEPRATRMIKITLPNPDQVPLRNMIRHQLCPYGDNLEQVEVLHYTIAGLVSLRENDYERAVYHMTLAREVDVRCVNLGGDDASQTRP